jgi:hypothetical protein
VLEFAIGVDVVEARLPLVTIIRLGKKPRCIKIPKEGTQKRRIYDALMNANGDWVNGRYFLRELYLSQYHRAIWELENDHHIKVEHSDFKDEHGFVSYRILQETHTLSML